MVVVVVVVVVVRVVGKASGDGVIVEVVLW